MLRIFLLLCCSFFASSILADDDIWLLIDTKAKKIEVKKGEKTLETFGHIAIGRKGAGLKLHRGDNITPYGEYRIGWFGERSTFHRFLGLNYPSVEDAKNALAKGIIDKSTHDRIINAHVNRQIPPQNTPLGGQIGIHGLGRADKRIHEFFDWTHGCIALTNGQIDQLSQFVDTGTRVRIK